MQGPSANIPVRSIDPKSQDFSRSLEVIRVAERFVLPVPNLGESGELLIYPPGDKRAGEAIKDDPAIRGVVFWNSAGAGWEGARGDGKTTIIINAVTPERAEKLSAYIELLSAAPEGLSLKAIKAVLSYAASELGLSDLYPKKKEHIDRDLAAGAIWVSGKAQTEPSSYFGVLKVVDKEPSKAIFISHPFRVTEPSDQTHLAGGFLVRSASGHVWPVETGAFLRTYKYPGEIAIGTVGQFLSKLAETRG